MPVAGPRPAKLNHAWIISEQLSDRFGHAFQAVGDGPCIKVAGPTKTALGSCLAHHGVLTHIVYEPASRFWALQGVETGLFAGVGAALLLFTAWWTHRRVA